MKIHFKSKAYLLGKKVELDNIVEFNKNGTVFYHTVSFNGSPIASREGCFDKNWSFDQFFRWRSERARVHFEHALKQVS